MSRSAEDDQPIEQDLNQSDMDSGEESSDDPEIEEDLLQEELRIDGICGVY
jgi:mycofactocin precursor